MVAQNDMRNLPSAAGGGGTDGTVAMTQDLLGRVFMAAQLGTSREGRILHQNKIISNFPTILGRQINQGFLGQKRQPHGAPETLPQLSKESTSSDPKLGTNACSPKKSANPIE